MEKIARTDEKGVVALLRKAVTEAGGMQAWANQAEVSIQYVSDVMHNRRRPGRAIYEALGFEKKIEYVKVA